MPSNAQTLHDSEPAQPRPVGEALIRDFRAGVRPLRIRATAPEQRRRRVALAHRIEQRLQTVLASIGVEEERRIRRREPIEHQTHTGGQIERSRIGGRIP